MKKVFNMLMEQAGSEGAAAGGAGSEGTQAAEGAGADDKTVAQNTGTPEDKGAGEKLFTLNVGGKIEKLTEAELINRGQQVGNITQKEQENAKKSKALDVDKRKIDMLISELETKEKSGEDLSQGEEDLLKKLNERTNALEDDKEQRNLDKAMTPIKTKYPDLNEDLFLKEFYTKVSTGEVEDSAAGMAEVAAGMAKTSEGKMATRLETALNDENNEVVKKHNNKVIADYVSGKKKRYHSSDGAGGGGGTGVKEKPIVSIDDAAKRARAMD